METIKITKHILSVVKKVILVALKYEMEMKRKLGITGEIGEVLVCQKLKLELVPALTAGFDALSKKSGERYQIKSRRAVNWERRYFGRIGRFARHKFDYAIFVILDKNYKLRELYQISYKRLVPILNRYTRRNLPIREFIRNACEKQTFDQQKN